MILNMAAAIMCFAAGLFCLDGDSYDLAILDFIFVGLNIACIIYRIVLT